MADVDTDERTTPLRARVLLAVCKSDWLEGRGTPLVVGCIDEVVWEHCDDAAMDAVWGPMKERVDPGGDYYEYREVIAVLDGMSARWVFDTPYVPTEIEASDA